ncbi:MAG: ABC transporter permease [Verrucomicrobiae bacterium]|nr:ABC transporter permease [Verrucomicrobiae bacterium]
MIFQFGREIWNSRAIVNKLALTEIRKKYLGSYLGIFWAFAQPVITIFIFWFVFELGFKATPVEDFPFLLWISAGMVPWFFISEALLSATGCILEQKFLVDKIKFRISMLPLIKILGLFYIHLFFLIFLIAIFSIYGYWPDVYLLQLPYYLLCTWVLVAGITWATSSLVLFAKDMREVVSICVQFGFWLTPIFWPLSILPERYHSLVMASPLYYIIRGYRESFIHKVWFWQHPEAMVRFWIPTLAILFFGIFIFRKLRPHFADVI